MLNNKKIVVFDLDGTLAESKQKLSKDMAELLLSLVKKVTVVIISGGSIEQFRKQFLPVWRDILSSLDDQKKLEINKNLILLPTSGSQRYEYNDQTNDWQIVSEEKLPDDLKNKIRTEIDEIIKSDLYSIPLNNFGERVEDRGTQITFSALGQDAPLALKKDWDPDRNKRQKIKQVLEKEIPEADFYIGGLTSVDILPKGFNKGVSLEKLLAGFSLPKSELVFVGDAIFPGGNDYSVLESGFESLKISGPDQTRAIIENWLS